MQQAPVTFDMMDRNHDGVITRAEFNQAAMMPTMTYAGAAPGSVVQQAVMMQPQGAVYSAPQQAMVYEQAAAPVMISGQPQVAYSAAQPAQVVYEQAAPAVTYAAPAAQVTYQQAAGVTYAAPAAAQIVYEQSAPAMTYATAPQVTYEQASPPVTYEAAPAAQMTYEQTAPAVTYASAAAAVPVPTLISYPANAVPQATTQMGYPLAVTGAEQPVQYAGTSVQLATEQSVPAAGSVSMVAPQTYMVESAMVAGAPPSMLTYAAPMVQPQAAYYQVGGMQAAAMQPQVALQPMMFEQQMVAQPCMAMTMPQAQLLSGGEQMMTVPAGATMEQSFTVPQQTSGFAAPVMEQPAVVTSKKAKKKLTSNKKKGKTCC